MKNLEDFALTNDLLAEAVGGVNMSANQKTYSFFGPNAVFEALAINQDEKTICGCSCMCNDTGGAGAGSGAGA